MKKLLLVTVLALGLPSLAYGNPQKTIPITTMKQVIKELKPVFCNNGESGLIKHISHCYLTSNNKEKCMLEDTVLIILHRQMSSLFKSQTGDGLPVDGFLSDPAIEERTKIYFNPYFGSVQNAMQYFDDSTRVIINNITNCSNVK